MKKKIILASSSPRRQEILKKMGLVFEVIPSDFEETFDDSDFSYEKIEKMACNKAMSVFERFKYSSPLTKQPLLIIGSDTVVILDGKILGKPQNKQDAINMLNNLSGKKHSVVTSICIINSETSENKKISTTSFVEFNVLNSNMIEDYVENYKPFDKAGSYGIQELPDGFIKSIEGSLENIIGLCPEALMQLLSEFKQQK